MSSFLLEMEKNIQAMKILTEAEEIPDGYPALASHTEISQLSCFWSSFIVR